MALSLAAAMLATFLAPACARAQAQDTACPDAPLKVVSFRFSDPAFRRTHSLVVLHRGYQTVQQAVEDLRREGWDPDAVINGGYFIVGEKDVVSYFRSSVFGNQLPRNSARSPRACMVYTPSEGFRVQQSTEQNYRIFQSLSDAEIYCAGPQLVEDGRDVAMRQFCREQFDPRCRDDHSDSGINFLVTYPRSGSCVTAAGDLELFMASSSQQKCGMTGPGFARQMAAHGCAAGLEHDGGGSAKLYADGAYILGFGDDRDRPSPTWAAVVHRAAR